MDTVYYERILGLFEHFMFGACSTYKLSAESLTGEYCTQPFILIIYELLMISYCKKKEFALMARRSLFRRGGGDKAVLVLLIECTMQCTHCLVNMQKWPEMGFYAQKQS